jgi:septum formation protein
MRKIVLATTSRPRKEIFGHLDIPFETASSDVDESPYERSDPAELVAVLSKLKAESVAKDHPDAIVIGMDSVAYFNGNILEKPKSKEEDFQRLKSLSGNRHQFYTGVHMIDTSSGKTLSEVVITDVLMRNFSDKEINEYLDNDPLFNTYALGYDPIRHISATFVKSIEGSYYNLLGGIPVETIVEMLAEIDR